MNESFSTPTTAFARVRLKRIRDAKRRLEPGRERSDVQNHAEGREEAQLKAEVEQDERIQHEHHERGDRERVERIVLAIK